MLLYSPGCTVHFHLMDFILLFIFFSSVHCSMYVYIIIINKFNKRVNAYGITEKIT